MFVMGSPWCWPCQDWSAISLRDKQYPRWMLISEPLPVEHRRKNLWVSTTVHVECLRIRRGPCVVHRSNCIREHCSYIKTVSTLNRCSGCHVVNILIILAFYIQVVGWTCNPINLPKKMCRGRHRPNHASSLAGWNVFLLRLTLCAPIYTATFALDAYYALYTVQ